MPAVAHRGRGRTHNRTGWSVGGGRAHRVGRTGASTRAIQGGLCARPPGTRARQGMPLLQPSPRRPDTPGRRPAPRCPAAPDGVPLLPSRRRTAQPFRGRPGGAARGDRARLGRPALSRLPPRPRRRPGGWARRRTSRERRTTPPDTDAATHQGRRRGCRCGGRGAARHRLRHQGLVRRQRCPRPRATWGAQSSSSLQPSRSADDESSAGSPLPASVGQPVEIGRGRLRNAESGLCLDVGGGRADSGAAAVLAACSSAGSQQWSYQGDGLLRSGVDPTLCLDSDTERHSVDLASCLAHGERRATTSRSAGNSCCAAARGCSSRRARGRTSSSARGTAPPGSGGCWKPWTTAPASRRRTADRGTAVARRRRALPAVRRRRRTPGPSPGPGRRSPRTRRASSTRSGSRRSTAIRHLPHRPRRWTRCALSPLTSWVWPPPWRTGSRRPPRSP